MKLRELISYIDSVKPSAFSSETKCVWVNEVEGAVQMQIMLLSPADLIKYDWDTDGDTVLLVPEPFTKLYYAYLQAMIDFSCGEYSAYANTMELYNRFWNEFASWYALRNDPAAGECEFRGYYLSAYAIAVKHGYTGTEEEWAQVLCDAAANASAAQSAAEESRSSASEAAASASSASASAASAAESASVAESAASSAASSKAAVSTMKDVVHSMVNGASESASASQAGAAASAESASAASASASVAAQSASEAAESASAAKSSASSATSTVNVAGQLVAQAQAAAKEAAASAEAAAASAEAAASGDYIPVPETAAVGQTIVVSEVDESGKPVAWECADLPSGGSGGGGGDIPEALPNPYALTFTGAVTGSYDGSQAVTVEIPSGGSGGGDSAFRLINTVNITEEVSSITIDKDSDGNAFEISEVLIYFDNTTYATGDGTFYFRPLCKSGYNMSCYGFINKTAGGNFQRWIYAKHTANGFWRAEFIMNTGHQVPLYSNPGETITSFQLIGQTFAAGNIYVYGR